MDQDAHAEPAVAAAPPPRVRRRLQSPHEVRTRRRRFVTYALFAGSCILMVNALVGESGYVTMVRTQREHAELSAALTARLLENQRMIEQIRRLRRDPAELEEAARRLGLIRPGETMITVRDARPAPDAPGK